MRGYNQAMNRNALEQFEKADQLRERVRELQAVLVETRCKLMEWRAIQEDRRARLYAEWRGDVWPLAGSAPENG